MTRRSSYRPPIAPDDVVRHALAAFYRAARECQTPPDHPEGEHWADHRDFMQTLTEFFCLRVSAQAHAAGVSGFDLAPQQLAKWDAVPAAAGTGGEAAVTGR